MRGGDALGMHRPTLQEQYLAGVSPQEAQAKFQDAVRQTKAYLAEMEVPQFYIDIMFATPKEKIYVVGEDWREYNPDPKFSYRGLTSYPPSIRDWVDAACDVSYLGYLERRFDLKKSSASIESARLLETMDLAIDNGIRCEIAVWHSARRQNP